MRTDYRVKGMSCAVCQGRVEKAVKNVAGVEACEVSLLTNSMTVDGTAAPEEIITAVSKAGYKAKLMKKNGVDSDSHAIFGYSGDSLKSPVKWQVIRLIASVIISIPLMILCYKGLLPYAQLILSSLVILINGNFFVNGVKGVLHKAPNMDTLVSLGSSVSYIYSLIVLILDNSHSHFYFDSAGMILTFISIGKLLEAVSKGKTTDAIDSLRSLAVSKAIVLIDGVEHEIDVSELKIGDCFIVRAGSSFPADGEVISGNGEADESSLTGESISVSKKPGDEVLTTTILISGELICRATRVGDDTFLASIIEMVSKAGSSKAPIAGTADRIAAIFVPVILSLSIITFLVWLLLFPDTDTALTLERAIRRGVAVMVISCPCALGLATPVAIMVGTGVGARKNILYKNATALENAARINHIVFDKTGTLTVGDITKQDELKPESGQAVKELTDMGYGITMLTGDKKEIAERIAQEANITDVIYEVLPGQKEETVSSLMKEGKNVMMVGDGINDAVALTRADVGVAIGIGKDVAIDSADIVLLGNSLTDVVKLLKISKATLKTIHENFFWALIYNAVGIPVAAGALTGVLGWEISPMFCALAMSLSSFCVVMNALRLNKRTF